MNKEEIDLFNDLWHIGTDMMSWDYKKPADELKEKIIKTFEENKQLKANRDEAIELLSKGVTFCENDSQLLHTSCLAVIKREEEVISILERGKE